MISHLYIHFLLTRWSLVLHKDMAPRCGTHMYQTLWHILWHKRAWFSQLMRNVRVCFILPIRHNLLS